MASFPGKILGRLVFGIPKYRTAVGGDWRRRGSCEVEEEDLTCVLAADGEGPRLIERRGARRDDHEILDIDTPSGMRAERISTTFPE